MCVKVMTFNIHHGRGIDKKVEDINGPAIVMGDWNMSPASKSWRTAAQYLQDVWVIKNPQNRDG
jgi:endonuclease/exonuclease/phosphatase family metal-dependent hydrolase